jgi:HAMP domain-containing protein
LRREIVALWLLALVAALPVTYLVARKIMQPVAELDRAAAEIAKQNYDYRIDVRSQDELGRLAGTFQSMCESIRQARQELIRRERISTIGQLSTSIVHDLRNPLAAIYAGAEMMMDGDIPEEQTRRLARNIYRASRGIQDMLQQLLDVVRGKSSGSEMCSLARSDRGRLEHGGPHPPMARKIELDGGSVPDGLECPMERAGWSGVFAIFLRMRSKPCVPAAASRSAGIGRRQHHGSRGGYRSGHQCGAAGTLVPAFCDRRQKERTGAGPGALPANAARSRRRHLADDAPGRNGGARFWLRLPKNRGGSRGAAWLKEALDMRGPGNFRVFVRSNDQHLDR